ncbi:hypothetical protein RYZ26_04990 [Terasakiella sp. A23]|uniref:hypothetical protein n=1 Tax=Terasakiella sp. FCG-A23 TaxID=3080561 RepID=UPI00295551AA|nr:hypothetical protein [Terasakiella sp. A23]MDV7338935.1 hypothetical protein [Terasakiella sp. A23]
MNGKMRRVTCILGAFAVVVALSACSSTKDYSDTVKGLKSAFDSSYQSFERIEEQVRAGSNRELAETIVDRKLTVAAVRKTCRLRSDRCKLTVSGGNLAGIPTSLPIKHTLGNSTKAMNSLKKYVSLLQKIATVDSAGQIEKHTNDAFASIKNINADFSKIKALKTKVDIASAYAKPVQDLVNWIVAEYVKKVKHDALAKVTAKAQPTIKEIGVILQGIENTAVYDAKVEAEKLFKKAQDDYDDAENRGVTADDVDAFVKASIKFDAALSVKEVTSFKAFVDAHTKLKELLNNEGEVKFSDVWKSIKEMKDKAEEFKKLIEAFKSN